jgi:hypothetical protein
MKKLIAAVLLACVAAGAQASNYPAESFNQNVKFVSKGPAVVARVQSMTMNKYVIGYKKSGIFGGSDSVLAIVKVACFNGPETFPASMREMIIKRDPYHDSGFLTFSLDPWDLCNGRTDVVKEISLAFSVGGQWDSQSGNNYIISKDDLDRSASWLSPDKGADIGIASWNYIAEQMVK